MPEQFGQNVVVSRQRRRSANPANLLANTTVFFRSEVRAENTERCVHSATGHAKLVNILRAVVGRLGRQLEHLFDCAQPHLDRLSRGQHAREIGIQPLNPT
jgi:hypothetical protein